MTYALLDQLGQDTGQRAATFDEAAEMADALGWRVAAPDAAYEPDSYKASTDYVGDVEEHAEARA